MDAVATTYVVALARIATALFSVLVHYFWLKSAQRR
jgi:hypothetical protein